MRRRVVITGVGCVTPLGVDADEFSRRLMKGHSGVGPITLFDASGFPVRIAAEVPDWDVSKLKDEPLRWQRHPRQTQFAVAAASEAVRSAGLQDGQVEPQRFGVITGCGEIFPEFSKFCQLTGSALVDERLQMDRFVDEAALVYQDAPDGDLVMEPGAAAGCIAGLFDAQGPNSNFTAACVSCSKAIGESTEIIRRGDADVMLAGGAHSMIHPFGVTGFHRLSTLSTRNDEPEKAARPFDRKRDGFVIGEGGAMLVLEELEAARRRGAEIWGEVSGWGVTHDAYRITDLDPQGRSAAKVIGLALKDAQVNPEDIDYINAHGSGTAINDKTETLAVKKALGECAYKVPMSSTKSMTGHLTTACGAIEAVACLLAIRDGLAPPTINYENFDPECDLDYVPNAAREISCRHAMSDTFGFGGQNVVLVFSQFDG